MDKESFINSLEYQKYHEYSSSSMIIPENKINDIKENFSTIISKEYKNVFYYDTHPSKTIFEFNDDNRFIFKITDNENSIKRYNNYLFSKYICDYFNLNLLKIPKTILVTIKNNESNIKFTIEEKMNIKNTNETHDEFEKNPDYLDDTIYQLVKFILKTKFSDVDYRNLSIINEDYKENNKIKKRIALIDLEDMDSFLIGLFGKPRVRGLLFCIGNKEQWKIIRDACIENGINVDDDYGYEFDSVMNKLK